MKKIIVTMAMMFTVGTISAFAANDEVAPKVLNAFSTDFNTAKEVEWTVGTNYYRAAFTFNEKHVFAFYNADGELLGLTRYISSLDLPMNLQSSLKKGYSDYWISDLFEVANNSGTNYYITVENADTKMILKATGDSDWKEYKKVRKA